jgi:drug/metabolite transporter (DMT)-like permease
VNYAAILVVLAGLTAALAYGVSDFLSARSSKSLGPIVSAILINAIGAICFAFVYAVWIRVPIHFYAMGMYYLLVSTALLEVGEIAFFKSLQKGPVSIVEPLSSMYPLATTLLVVLVFHVHLSIMQLCSIGLVVLGIILTSEMLGHHKKRFSIGPILALSAAAAWGTGYILLTRAIQILGWGPATLIEFISGALMLVGMFPLFRGKEKLLTPRVFSLLGNRFILGAAFIQLIGEPVFNFGLTKGSSFTAILAAVSACYPILTVFLALKRFRERIRPPALLGVVFGIVGIIVLSFSSVSP